MATFGQLKELVRRDIERTDISSNGNAALTNDSIAYYVLAAIDFYKTEQFSFNQATSTVSITSGSETAALPSDFARFICWRITTSGYQGELIQAEYSELERNRIYQRSNATKPTHFAIFNNALELFPTPSANLSTKFSYVKTLAAPVNSGDGGAWVNEARLLIAAKAKEYIFTHVLEDTTNAAMAANQATLELGKLQERNIHHNAIGKVSFNSWM